MAGTVLITLDDVLKGSKVFFCEAVVEMNLAMMMMMMMMMMMIRCIISDASGSFHGAHSGPQKKCPKPTGVFHCQWSLFKAL